MPPLPSPKTIVNPKSSLAMPLVVRLRLYIAHFRNVKSLRIFALELLRIFVG